ncbi:MAG TPA: hypothetical protein VM510_00760 [Caulifigura sp.]|jgi:hypothetical protein|nr:hypothetical protein [Caulifigura sp.]
MPVPYLKNPPPVIGIDRGRQLFVDDFLIENTSLSRVFHKARKFEGNPVFKAERANELDPTGKDGGDARAFCYLGHGGVFFDPADQLFKMFYTAGWRGGLAMATSKDLVHWSRPDLKLAGGNLLLPPGTKRDESQFATAGGDNSLWFDINAKDPGERLKFLTGWSGRVHSLHTSDGTTWKSSPPIRGAGDYCSFFYNPFRNKWVYSIKREGPRGRSRDYLENDEFMKGTNWSDSVFWTNVDRLDAPEPAGRYPGAGETPQLYSLNAVAYESLMVGMHYIHRGPNNKLCQDGKFPKLTDLELGFSRDGFHWDRPDRSGFITGEREAGTWDRAYLHSTTGVFVVHQDRLVFPYTGVSGVSPSGAQGMYTGGSIGLASLRRDGFASMNAGDKPGLLTTRPVSFRGSHLFVNADASHGGLRVAVVDEAGQPIAPYTFDRCQPLTADDTLQAVSWNGAENLARFAGKPIRFQFELTNGSLYSFWVSQDETGRSDGYVAAGGPGYPGLVDTVGKLARPATPVKE